MTRAHVPLRGALRVRMADGETCHADELADALAGLVDAVEAHDRACGDALEGRSPGADEIRAAAAAVLAAAGEAAAFARAVGVVVSVEVTP